MTVAPCITLTSDFGTRDPYVGIMKSRILQRLAGAGALQILDLTHDITPFRPEEAGFWLWRSAPQFAPGSVHLAVVDPGVGTARALVAVQAHGQLFVAPDNGLLGLVCESDRSAQARRIDAAALTLLGLTAVSATFHGRDILGPVAAELAMRRLRFEQLGVPTAAVPGRLRIAASGPDGVLSGAIAAIDRYGNLLSTIDAAAMAGFARPLVELGGQQFPLVRTYGEALNGSHVALINSFGVLEIARVCGSAAEGLRAQWRATVSVREGARS